jgi:hypothetical protein
MNLIEMVLQEMLSDDEDSDRNSERIKRAYEAADEKTKAVIDDVLICVCGWGMPSLQEKLAGPTHRIEVQMFPMTTDEDGAHHTQPGEDPDHYDVTVTKLTEATGQIDTLEEHEDLTEEQARQVFDRLCKKWPDADHTPHT